MSVSYRGDLFTSSHRSWKDKLDVTFVLFQALKFLEVQSRSLKLQSMKVIEKIYVMTQLGLYSNFIHDRSL